MATLISQGVDVEIIDQSAYAGGSPQGTTPLIVVATSTNKTNPSGSLAPMTVPAQANQLFLATSQLEITNNYGAPQFTVTEGTPVHGDEVNEYGLLAAYSFLGISSSCYVLRADIDLSQLVPSTSAPTLPPATGTYWLDLGNTVWGVFQANGNSNAGLAWTAQTVLVALSGNVDSNYVPLTSYGTNGAYAVVPLTANNVLYQKIGGSWYSVGSTQWLAANPTVVTGTSSPTVVGSNSTLTINSTNISVASGANVANVATNITNAAISHITATVSNGALKITNTAGGSVTIAGDAAVLTAMGLTAKTYSGVSVTYNNTAQYPDGSVAGSVWVKGTSSNNGSNIVVKYYNGTAFTTLTTPSYPFDSTKNDGDVTKDAAALASYGTAATGNLYIGYDATYGLRQLRRWNGSAWSSLVYQAGYAAPTTSPAAGTYWYNTDFQADIMIGNGENWYGYRNVYPNTDPNGVIISGSAPLTQSDGSSLVDNDIWLNSSDTENYPALYRYTAATMTWSSIDLTDHTTPNGIVFADARPDAGPTYINIPNSNAYTFGSTDTADLILSNYCDPDAPDPRLYPSGMLLFNTRYSTNNVKVWTPGYFLPGGFDPNTNYTLTGYNIGDTAAFKFNAVVNAGRWVTASGNKASGAPYMGRKAQRAMVVRAMAAALESNQDIRSEIANFNLIAAPGYAELISDMITLNTDNKETAFIVADTPIRLQPSANAIQKWATNANDAASDGDDGLTSSSPYVGVYYPWGLGTDLSGNQVMIPPSSIALRTIANNDNVGELWFAPAGFNRGLVTNAASVGYLTTAGNYQPTILNQGQRDTLYSNKINPIAYIPNKGLVVYGQKTLNPTSTALDRINVARLCCYLSYQLSRITLPYLDEQNDIITRSAAQHTVQSFLSSLMGKRALNDFAVVCDTTNNTPQRIDANELWIDVLIQPLKAIEFIYVPVRLLATGASMTLDTTSSSS